MTKAELRALYKAKRQGLSADDVARGSEQISRRFQEYMDALTPAYIHLFLPIRQQNEIDTWSIINWLWQYWPAVTVVTSVSYFKTGGLTHFALTPQTKLFINRYGIPEPNPTTSIPINPSAIDLVLVPLLILDQLGHRVGYGKGFYDRFLAECRLNCLKVGLSLFEPVERIADVAGADIRLNACITPTNLYQFL